MSRVPALTLEDDIACLDEIETPESEQATVPFRSLPLYPRQLRCLAEVAAAFGNREFTRIEVSTLSGDDYVNGADDPLWQLLQREFVRVLVDVSGQSFAAVAAAGHERDGSTVLGELASGGGADAAARTGDEGGSAGQF